MKRCSHWVMALIVACCLVQVDQAVAGSEPFADVSGIDAAGLTTLEYGFQGMVANPVPGASILTYNFASLATKIMLGDCFVIGSTLSCANDVILAYGDGAAPPEKGGTVPEPATMILFGAGITGLAAWSRRRKK